VFNAGGYGKVLGSYWVCVFCLKTFGGTQHLVPKHICPTPQVIPEPPPFIHTPNLTTLEFWISSVGGVNQHPEYWSKVNAAKTPKPPKPCEA
jgi:hypothetical protein